MIYDTERYPTNEAQPLMIYRVLSSVGTVKVNTRVVSRRTKFDPFVK